MLTLEHPGPPTFPRIISLVTTPVAALGALAPGRTLADELFRLLAGTGLTSGMAEFTGGSLEPISYCIPADGRDGCQVSYSEAQSLERGYLVFGTATLGTREGEPWMHSHCVWLTARGDLRSGHLWPATAVGFPAPVALVQGLPGVELTSDDDPETRMPVFTPRTADAEHRKTAMEIMNHTNGPEVGRGSTGRTVVARVCPNEDLTTAVEEICHQYGIKQAILRGGIGSLIGATFTDFDGGTRRVEGPGTEVATLVGHASAASENTAAGVRAELTCTLVDKHGRVHAGLLARGENPVAVTYELFVQEVLHPNEPSSNRTKTHKEHK